MGWPAVLRERLPDNGTLTVRPVHRRDARAWQLVREGNREWLQPWDATMPPGTPQRSTSYPGLIRRLRRAARDGTTMPFVIEVDGRFAGQVTVNNIVRGPAQFASIGYWVGREYAGRGAVPLAVAAVLDHCFGAAGLHRIEIAIRPENSNSLRVVEKLGLREVGFAPGFLHIDGAWRDHRIFAITAEECPQGVVNRLLGPRNHTSHIG